MPTVANNAGLGVLVPGAPGAASPASARPAVEAGLHRVRIWDVPTRVFHWSLAASVGGLAVTGYAGGAWMDWHARLGTLTLALLLFRIVWGCIGGRWSRFASFLPTPARLQAYLRGKARPEDDAGHSPLGALSVLAMLLVLFAQVATGLVSDDGGGFIGPLNESVSSALAAAGTMLHKQVGQWVLLALVLLHIVAIGFYRIVRRRKLVRAMVDGDKLLPVRVAATRDDGRTRALAAAAFGVCLLVVGTYVGF
jgi:cytochrome b